MTTRNGKRAWLWGATGLGALALVFLAMRSVRGTAADSTSEGLELARAQRRDISAVVAATGVVEPRVGAEVRVGSRISGVVRRLHVHIGDTVRRGQLLAELDERDLAARQAEAAATLRRLEAERHYAVVMLDRARALRESNGIAIADVDAAERAFTVAAELVAAASAAREYAAAQLDYARIVAPISGVVASVSTQEGETVAASFAAPTFVTLIDLERLEVRAYVDETDIGRIRTGQTAQFTVDTYGNHEFEGRVTAVYPKAEIRDNVVNYVTVITFQPPRDRVLRPEMTTTVRIAVASRRGVLAVPLRAVRRSGGHTFVMVSRSGTTLRHSVTTGLRDDAWVEIVEGLHEGDSVVVGNTLREENES